MQTAIIFDPETGDYALFLNQQWIGYAPTQADGQARILSLALSQAAHAHLPCPAALWQEYQADPARFYERIALLTPDQRRAFAIRFASFANRELDCPAMPDALLQVWERRIAAQAAPPLDHPPVATQSDPPPDDSLAHGQEESPC